VMWLLASPSYARRPASASHCHRYILCCPTHTHTHTLTPPDIGVGCTMAPGPTSLLGRGPCHHTSRSRALHVRAPHFILFWKSILFLLVVHTVGGVQRRRAAHSHGGRQESERRHGPQ
jgi:hypothetical protein